MKKIYLLVFISLTMLFACNQAGNKNVVRLSDQAFVYGSKLYLLNSNELVLLADLEKDTIRKSELPGKAIRNFGRFDIEGEADAFSDLTGIYRNSGLNFRLEIKSFKDLYDKYQTGNFTLTFTDKSNFPVARVEIPLEQIRNFEYTGRLEMTYDDYTCIEKYNISANLQQKEEPKKQKSSYDANDWY